MERLSAGRYLKNAGFNVTILEARDRVGGRTLTIRGDQYGGSLDLGGAYVGPGQRRVQRLAKELGLEFYKLPIKGKTVTHMSTFKAIYEGDIPPMYNPITVLDVNDLLRRLNDMARQVPVDAPWKAAHAREWDQVTCQAFLEKTCWSNLAVTIATVIIRSLGCCEPHEISLLALLWYIQCGENIQNMIQIENGAQERKIVGGSMQISEKMATDLDVRLSHPVIMVNQNGDDGKIHVITTNGTVFKCNYVISAIPLTLLNRVQFIPCLDSSRLQMIQRMPMGSIIKTATYYKEAYWLKQGLSGEMSTDTGPVNYCMDDTKPDGSFPALMGFILAQEARKLCRLSKEERQKIVAEHYADRFGIPELRTPVNYEEHNWMSEEYSGGCYSNNYPPGVLTGYGDVIRQPHGNVFFAGTETAMSWSGYMEGAIESGERAAREILHREWKITKSEIYQDEASEPYYFTENPIQLSWVEQKLPSVGKFLLILVLASGVLIAILAHAFGLF